MADRLKALEEENKELKKLLAKAKELLLTYHDILQQPEYAGAKTAAAKPRPSKKRVAKKTKSAKSVKR